MPAIRKNRDTQARRPENSVAAKEPPAFYYVRPYIRVKEENCLVYKIFSVR